MSQINRVQMMGAMAAAFAVSASLPIDANAKTPFSRDKHGVPVGYVCYKGSYSWSCYLPTQRVPPTDRCYATADGKFECFAPATKVTAKTTPPMMYCQGKDGEVSYVCYDAPSPAPPPPPPQSPSMPPQQI